MVSEQFLGISIDIMKYKLMFISLLDTPWSRVKHGSRVTESFSTSHRDIRTSTIVMEDVSGHQGISDLG
jgi:hypothetical protein